MFVTKKITKGVARIIKGDKTPIYLGNINSIRDWGHSKDYVNSMYLILNHTTPDDWLVSSGVTHTVRDFVESAFNVVNIKIIWQGEGVNEVGINSETNEVLVAIDSKFIRPAEVDLLYGNSNKIRNILNWEPHYKFEDLVKEMVEYDIAHT
jgi:GDPmannose 4,6-dehydratase